MRRDATRPLATAAVGFEPETLVVSHLLDVGDEGEPYSGTLRVSGRRLGTTGKIRAQDTFVQTETIDDIVPGSGPMSVTTWIPNLLSGDWTVSADLLRSSQVTDRSARHRPVALREAAWSWRHWNIAPTAAKPVKTRWAATAPLARQPAVLPGIYVALAVVGFAVALVSQASILDREGVDAGLPFAASLLALIAGLTAARVWYAILHHGALLMGGGWAVDGFLVVAPLTVVAALHFFVLPIGVALDSTTPGIFLAIAIGRIGCFLAGCCAGRATRSQWAVWSSDRRVGTRRIPTQLLEAVAGLIIGIVSLFLIAGRIVPIAGAVFVLALAVYAVIRQVLLRLRAERRESAGSLPLTGAVSATALLLISTVVSAHGA